jgi:hypothetical protein
MGATEDCEAASQSEWLSSAELLASAALIGLIIAGVVIVRSWWARWFERIVVASFQSVDVDDSGTIEQAELWAGVLSMYLALRQQNIPADPPPREKIMELMSSVDQNTDGKLSLDEFRQIVGHLSMQALGRAITILIFVATWPVLVSVAYNAASAEVKEHGPPPPASLACVLYIVDDLHILPLLLTILGFVVVVPRVSIAVDGIMGRALAKFTSSAVDPRPLLSSAF